MYQTSEEQVPERLTQYEPPEHKLIREPQLGIVLSRDPEGGEDGDAQEAPETDHQLENGAGIRNVVCDVRIQGVIWMGRYGECLSHFCSEQ